MGLGWPAAFRAAVWVLVDESGAGAVALDRLAWADRDNIGGVVGCALVDPAMGAVAVVVVDVLDEQPPELRLVPDDGAVQEFVAQRSDPSVRIRVRTGSPWWDPYRCDPRAGEHSIEGPCELSGAVSDEVSEPVVIAESHEEVAGGLGGPWPGRVGRDPSEVHATGVDLDDEQDVEPAQECRVDTREVSGDDPRRLGPNELDPRWPGPIASRVDARGAQDLPHG